MNNVTTITEYRPEKSSKSVFRKLLLAAFCIGLMLLFYHCPFKMITGIDCPGCGLTRAFCCILLCDLKAAVQYHPLSPFLFVQLISVIYMQFILKKKMDRRIMLAAILINALLMLAVWLYKIIL